MLKSSLAILIVVASAAHSFAAKSQSVQWLDDPEVAAREAARTGKPILMQVTATWCGYCHKMFRETYVDPGIVQTANNDFICLKVDADQHKKLVDGIGVKALPTTVVLTPSLRVAKKLSGYQTVARLGSTLKETRLLARQAVQPPQTDHRTQRPVTQPQITAQRSQTAARQPAPQAQPRSTTKAGNPFAQFDSPQPRTAARVPVKAVTQSRVFPDGFDRMCLVTLFDQRKVETGSANYSSPYRSRTVYFTSAEAKARFDANPERYWPVLDGYCAVTYLEHSRRVQGNPVFGAVFRERMWFFNSAEQMEAFIANPKEYLPQTPAI